MLVCALSQESEDTALTIAADQGHEKVVSLLLQRGANIDHQVSTADLSCVVSAASSLVFCCCVLQRSRLQYQPETCPPVVHKQDVYGQTALYSASSKNHIKVVEALLVGEDAGLWLYLCSMTSHPDGVASFGCF